MFSFDSESPAEKVELNFLHYKVDGWWDFPKQREQKIIEAKYVFFGPTNPQPPTKRGYKFDDDEGIENLQGTEGKIMVDLCC